MRILPPYQQFYDLNGGPLNNGYLYIGTPNQNPETSPVTVYWDFARTIPAAQPIRTVNGYPSLNGRAANLFIANQYSLTVRNSRHAQVFYSATSTELQASLFMEGFLALEDAEEARTYLEAVGLVGDESIDGIKTFLDTPVLPAIGNGLVPVGTILDFGGSVAPTGFLGCNGAAVNRVTYARLFAAIGVLWGAGDGVTTFNLPNFARRTAVGSGGAGTGTLGNAVGNTGGSETHTLTEGEMPAHDHDIQTVDATGGTAPLIYRSTNGNVNAQTTNVTGGSQAHNNMQPSAIVLKIIKT